jgi:hypothetical protein
MRPRALAAIALVILSLSLFTTGCASSRQTSPPPGGPSGRSEVAGGPDVFSVAGGGLGKVIPSGTALVLKDVSVVAYGAGTRFATPTPSASPATLPPPSPSTTITVFAGTAAGNGWQLRLTAPLGHTLTPGTYANSAAEPATDVPTVDIDGGSQACTVKAGSFTIYEDDVDAKGVLTNLNLTFDIKCQRNPVDDPSLVGYVRYHATKPTPIPAIPSPPPPPGPPTSAEPTEFAVRAPAVWPPAQHKNLNVDSKDVAISGTLGDVRIAAAGWELTFAAISGQHLAPGLYPTTTRHAAVAGVGGGAGLDIAVNGAGCRVQVGRLTIYEIHADAAGNVDRFSADFSQMECDTWNATPTTQLIGFVRYRATIPTPLPWR